MTAKIDSPADAKATESGSWAPEFSTVDHKHEFPQIDVIRPFVLVHSPTRWFVTNGRLVPMLSTVSLGPGLSGVDRGGDGRYDATLLKARLEREGRVLIPHNWAPDKKSYVKRVMTKFKGRVRESYISVFASVHAGDNKIYPDMDAYSEWLASLVADGKIAKCPVHRVRTMLEDSEAALAKAHDDAANNPKANLTAEIARLEEVIKVLKAELGDGKPKSKKVEGKSTNPMKD